MIFIFMVTNFLFLGFTIDDNLTLKKIDYMWKLCARNIGVLKRLSTFSLKSTVQAKTTNMINKM